MWQYKYFVYSIKSYFMWKKHSGVKVIGHISVIYKTWMKAKKSMPLSPPLPQILDY